MVCVCERLSSIECEMSNFRNAPPARSSDVYTNIYYSFKISRFPFELIIYRYTRSRIHVKKCYFCYAARARINVITVIQIFFFILFLPSFIVFSVISLLYTQHKQRTNEWMKERTASHGCCRGRRLCRRRRGGAFCYCSALMSFRIVVRPPPSICVFAVCAFCMSPFSCPFLL